MRERRRSRSASSFVPALGRLGTRFYDPLLRLTTRERRFRSRVLELAAPRPGDRLLDLGCGTGTLAVGALTLQPAVTAAGLDADMRMLDRAAAKARAAGLRLHLTVGTATRLPYPDGAFDVVISTLLFHHLRGGDKDAAAREIARVLAPGGRLVLADWGPPGDPLMRALSLTVRLADGLEPTRDVLAGRLPAILRSAGLCQVAERDRLRTAFGSLRVLEAHAAGPVLNARRGRSS